MYQVASLTVPLFRAAMRSLRRIHCARRVLDRRIIREPHVLAAKYANRWANRVLRRPIRGWPWLVSEEEMQRAAEARTPGKVAATFVQDLERAIAWSGLESEGRVLRALRVRGSAPAWARVGESVGLTEEARQDALREGQRIHQLRLVRGRALRRAARPAALVAEEGDVEACRVEGVEADLGEEDSKGTRERDEGAEGDGSGTVARGQRGSSAMLLLPRAVDTPAFRRARPGPLPGMLQRARAAVAGVGAMAAWGWGRQRGSGGSALSAGVFSSALPAAGEVESGHRDRAGTGNWTGSRTDRGEGGDEVAGCPGSAVEGACGACG